MYCQGNDCKLWAKLPIAVVRFKLELGGKKSELLTSKKIEIFLKEIETEAPF